MVCNHYNLETMYASTIALCKFMPLTQAMETRTLDARDISLYIATLPVNQ